MNEFLNSTLELMVLLPGMLMAYLPMKQYLRMRPAMLAAFTIPLTLSLSLAGGFLHCLFDLTGFWLFVPAVAIAGTFYIHTLNITRWKSVSVFLAVCGAFSCMLGAAAALNDIISPGSPFPPLSPCAAACWLLLCCALVAAVWYPSTHAARRLLEEDAFAQTWYIFWLLPILFIGLSVSMLPVNQGILDLGRLRSLYIIISISLLLLLLLFYALFYLMATSLNRNDMLRRENQFLSMQQARYDSLRTAIAQTREARHDMRHHFNVLSRLAGQKEWESLVKYLSDAQDSIPDAELNLCDNPAADSVASHYALLCRKCDIPFSFELDLPFELPVREIDLCLAMSNLLENALEASLKTAPANRRIKLQAHLHSGHMVMLTVENTFEGAIREKDGVFQSSKRRGEGVGIQSVRHIAEKNGGYSRFFYEDGIFCADVILRGDR